jgi:pyrrolidone-carboxylate peptidase
MLSESGFKYVISNNAGNYLCNHIYYHGLKFISEYDKKPGMIFRFYNKCWGV